ncbi:hypothetical protein AB0B25_00770 [Nocardia sp. NPDC049190]|uniref:hypothetical protein n=1 Tax=Nocardia sp. NPDC049190 TaxID=3155650 RepID=UPI00340D4511
MPPQRRKGSIGRAANPLSDGAEHTPPVSPLRDAEWRRRGTELRSVPATPDNEAETASLDVLTMPLPVEGEGPLNDREQAQLTACESSIDSLRMAFWAAGRALQIVRDGRLYRDSHGTFDDYVEQRWDMQRSYAHKLIRAWPLAAKLHPVAPGINEGQVRELLPVAAEHGEDAAVTVYTTIADTTGNKVTAGKIREAVAMLPDRFDQADVIERLQAWLRGEVREGPAEPTADLFATVGSRFAALTRRVVEGSSYDPTGAREFAAKLRTLAEQIEERITP